MYRLKTKAELLADGWLENGCGSMMKSGCIALLAEMMNQPQVSMEQSQNIATLPDGCNILLSTATGRTFYYRKYHFTEENAAPKGISKPFENIEEGGCICFMKKHRFSGHMRYCPAYS